MIFVIFIRRLFIRALSCRSNSDNNVIIDDGDNINNDNDDSYNNEDDKANDNRNNRYIKTATII